MWCDAPQATLAVIEHHESGGRNVMNFINDERHTAGGFWQITNTTWRGSAAWAGVNLAQYPTAISAPCEVQRAVASALYERLGVLPWAPFNRELAMEVGYTGPMYDENGRPLGSPPYRPVVYVTTERPVRRATDEVWE